MSRAFTSMEYYPLTDSGMTGSTKKPSKKEQKKFELKFKKLRQKLWKQIMKKTNASKTKQKR